MDVILREFRRELKDCSCTDGNGVRTNNKVGRVSKNIRRRPKCLSVKGGSKYEVTVTFFI